MAKYSLKGLFDAIAVAIRYKAHTTDLIAPEDFPDAIYEMHTDWDATISSGDQLLKDITAYGKGIKYTGTIPTNTQDNLHISHNTITTDYGYYDSATSQAIPISTLDDSIIGGTSFEEASGDYGWKSTIEIPEGYHNKQTLIKTFSSILPRPGKPGSAAEVLLGYQFYDMDGKLIEGTMPNNGSSSSTITTQHASYTIPKGYHDGTGKITANIVSYDGKITIK